MDADFITRQELENLIGMRSEVCISIYLPMTRVGPDVQGNPLRLKNALSDVEKHLKERGWRQSELDGFLQAPRALLNEGPFWQHQLDGLVVFLAPDFLEMYRLPLDFEPLTVVAERFHIKPLLPLFSDDGRFYILALSRNRVRLFQGMRHAIDEMVIDPAPSSMDEALAYEDPEAQLQHHTTDSGSAGGPAVVHHGHGVPDNEKKNRLRRFLQQVSKGISEKLAGEESPMLLAAVDYLHPIYKEIASSPHLLDEGITGNPDNLTAKELHEKAWKIVEPLFEAAKEEVETRYYELRDSVRASSDLREIVPASHRGRVDALFVAVDTQKWGNYDPETGAITLHQEPRNGDEDLLDFTAVQTLSNGGTVYAVDQEDVPGKAPLAAVFRF